MGRRVATAVVAAALAAAAALVGAPAPAEAAGRHRANLALVTEWEATPLVPLDAAPRFAEAGVNAGAQAEAEGAPLGRVCGTGRCPFVNGVCCSDSATCCEWGKCSEDGRGACKASAEQNSLLLAKMYVSAEAQVEVQHELDLKSRSEQGLKLQKETSAKNAEEDSQKKEATAQEAKDKKEATQKHEARLAKAEADEQSEKTSEANSKRGEQSAMMSKFESEKEIVLGDGRTQAVAAGSCFAQTLTAPPAFTYMFWYFLNTEVAQGERKNLLETNQLQVQTLRADGANTLQITLYGRGGAKTFAATGLKAPTATWVHVAVAASSDSALVYANGALVQTVPLAGGFDLTGTQRPGRACASDTAPADAQIADLRLQRSVRPAAQVMAAFKEAKYSKAAVKSALRVIKADSFRPSRGLKVASDADVAVSSGYSMGLRLRVQGQLSTPANILHKGSLNGGSGPTVTLTTKSGKNVISVTSSGTTALVEVPALFKWFHLAWTHTATKLTLFVDGQQVGSEDARLPEDNDGDLYAAWPHGDAAPVFAAGLTYAPAAWDAADLKALMAATYNPDFFPPVQPVVKSQKLSAPGTYPPSKAAAEVSTLFPPARCRTWTFWVKPEDTSATPGWDKFRSVLQKGSNDPDRAPAFFLMPSSTKLHMRSGTDADANYGLDYATNLPTGLPTHIAVVHCHRLAQLYINAVLKNSDTNAAEPRISTGPLVIPANYGFPAATGTVSDVRYYDFALSNAQVRDILELGLSA